ncbi:MAG TPA: hypothetical protein VFQ53_19580 [Kofleriaceae bacterium]|nr:hypothetical protein [Kofleriaceae bacterium]
MATLRDRWEHVDHETALWIGTVAACSLFVLAIMLIWSRLRGY